MLRYNWWGYGACAFGVDHEEYVAGQDWVVVVVVDDDAEGDGGVGGVDDDKGGGDD